MYYIVVTTNENKFNFYYENAIDTKEEMEVLIAGLKEKLETENIIIDFIYPLVGRSDVWRRLWLGYNQRSY